MHVGIDLGTTFSLIARMTPGGQPVLIPDYSFKNAFPTPSIVHIKPAGAFVGQMVNTLLREDPNLPYCSLFKRRFGKTDPVYYDNAKRPWHPEAIAALLLRKLRYDAEFHVSTDVTAAVITIPAHFNDLQRKAVLTAAELAGIPVLGLLEEPVAAALHYGFTSGSREQILMVYDLGGGTFDVTILTITDTGVHVMAKDGETELGGSDFDKRIGELVLGQFKKSPYGEPTLNAATLLDLQRASEALKIELCMPGQNRVTREVTLGGKSVEVRIRRSEFEQAIADKIDKTEAIIQRCLKSAGLTPKEVDALLLVGGSSMIPLIKERLCQRFNHTDNCVRFHEPTRAIAFGAALHTAQLTGAAVAQLPPKLNGVTGYCVGVRARDPKTGQPIIDTLIRKNAPLPSKVNKTYFTTYPRQDRVVFELFQYHDPDDDLVNLGHVVIGPLPPLEANHPIQVTVENREDGTVAITAYDPTTRLEVKHTFGRRTGQTTDSALGDLSAQKDLIRSMPINDIL